jgi:hypothetical protein
MDATTGLAATRQTLDALKAVPAWLLLSLCAIFSIVWLLPQYFVPLPPRIQAALPLALLATGILVIFKLSSVALSFWLARRRLARARDHDRLLNLYRPLIALFLTRHVTTCTGRASPYLRHRISNAWQEVGVYRRRWTGLKRAWRALFDRQVSSSAEIEFGGDFPLSDIVRTVRDNSQHASVELIRLVNRADRSRYEEPDSSLLTDAEYALFSYIDAQHRRLSASTS